MALPEIRTQCPIATVEQTDIVEDLIVVVVFGVDTQHRSLDAQVDVLGDESDAGVWVDVLQTQGGIEYRVIGVAARQEIRHVPGQGAGLEE